MGEIKKTKNFGLGLPEHFDPSVDKMSQNMNIIDSALFKSIPSKVSTDLNFNTAITSGTYLIAGNATGTPSSTTSYNYALTVFATDSTHVYQIARGMGGYTMFFRYKNGSTSFGSWYKIWNAGNDGTDSGLDADLLDGIQGYEYVRNFGKTYTDFNTIARTGFYQVGNAKNSPDGTNTLWGCIAFQTDGGTSTNSYYLCQIAIKDNSAGKQLYTRKRNGSNWTAWEKIWTSATDGDGSGLDADTVDGSHATDFVKVADFGDFDYVVSSQAEFDTLIASSNWLGAKSVVFLCDVDAGEPATAKSITIPGSVVQIEGLNHTINYCYSFGYDVAPDPHSYYRSDRYIRNLSIVSGGSSVFKSYDVSGFKNCVNLYNCYAEVDTYAPNVSCFDHCINLVDCEGFPSRGASGSYANTTIKLFNTCYNLTRCTCQNSFADKSTAGYYAFYNCTNLVGCTCYLMDNAPKYSMFNQCLYLYDCKIIQRYSDDTPRTFAVGFEDCSDLINCYSTTQASTALYKNCRVLVDCSESTDWAVDCSNAYKSHQIMHTISGGTDDDYLEIYNLPTGTYTVDSGYVRYFSNGLSVECTTPQTFIWDKESGFLTVITQQGVHRYSLDTTTNEKISELTFNVDTDAHLLDRIKNVDGISSGLDADLLDGRHGYGFSTAGTSSSLLTTGTPNSNSSCVSQMYRFYDTSDVIGEGKNSYYGVIQVYSSSSSYMRIAVSFSSGKVYRQSNGASAWSEITPLIPVLTADPPSPSNGQLWIRSDL